MRGDFFASEQKCQNTFMSVEQRWHASPTIREGLIFFHPLMLPLPSLFFPSGHVMQFLTVMFLLRRAYSAFLLFTSNFSPISEKKQEGKKHSLLVSRRNATSFHGNFLLVENKANTEGFLPVISFIFYFSDFPIQKSVILYRNLMKLFYKNFCKNIFKEF